MGVLFTWWAWLAAAMLLAILEVLAPVFVFIGLAVGAAVVGVMLVAGIGFGGSLAWLLVVFAAVSLVATLVFRRVLGRGHDETKTFEEDING
jgi:membrane protein implicated in regulation of membrane protease activity